MLYPPLEAPPRFGQSLLVGKERTHSLFGMPVVFKPQPLQIIKGIGPMARKQRPFSDRDATHLRIAATTLAILYALGTTGT